MTTRCKFKVDQINEYAGSYEYVLSPVYGSPENKAYWESTPSGRFAVSIVKDKGRRFEFGKEYIIDISEA